MNVLQDFAHHVAQSAEAMMALVVIVILVLFVLVYLLIFRAHRVPNMEERDANISYREGSSVDGR